MPSVNLIPARRRAARLRRRNLRWCAVGCAAYALLAAGAGAAALAAWGGRDAAVARQLAIADKEGERSARALEQTRVEFASTNEVLTTARQIVGQPDWSGLLALVSAKASGQVILKNLQLHPAAAAAADGAPAAHGYVLTIEGLGRSPSDVQQYVLRLENSRLFDRVTLLDTRSEPFLDIEVSAFRVECGLGSSSAPEDRLLGKDK